MEDLQHSRRRTEAKSARRFYVQNRHARRFYVWHEDEGDYLSGFSEKIKIKVSLLNLHEVEAHEVTGAHVHVACVPQSSCSWARGGAQLQERRDTRLSRLTDNPLVLDGLNFKAAGGGF